MNTLQKQKAMQAGKIASQVREYAKSIIKKGIPLLEIAEKKLTVHSASLNYNRAQYLQLQEIIENNNKLLEQKGVSVDISEYIKTAEEYAESAEDFTTIHASNYRYNKAQYYMNEAVLKQQEALK